MTVAPARYCPVQNCPNRTDGGPCPEHAAAREHRRPNFLWRRLYHSARWQATRRYVLDEEPVCSDCLAEQRVTPSEDVHHKVRPMNEEMFFDRTNLTALCHACHARRTGRGE